MNFDKNFAILNNVDLVNLGPISVFMYKQDNVIYKRLPQELKEYPIQDHIVELRSNKKLKSEWKISAENTHWVPLSSLLQKIIDHLWKYSISFLFVDVGCQYAALSMSIARHIKINKKSNKIFAFDCGIAAQLSDYNIRLNQLEDIIKFEYKAVSNLSIPHLVFCDIEHPEDNHVIKRVNTDFSSYVVDAVTIDEYFSNVKDNLIIKIDTQGAEPLVFEGMKNILNRVFPIVIFEFTPWAYEITKNPLEVLSAIPDDYTIFNIDEKTNKLEKIERQNFGPFIENISRTEPYWTDLLILHKSLPGHNELIQKIS